MYLCVRCLWCREVSGLAIASPLTFVGVQYSVRHITRVLNVERKNLTLTTVHRTKMLDTDSRQTGMVVCTSVPSITYQIKQQAQEQHSSIIPSEISGFHSHVIDEAHFLEYGAVEVAVYLPIYTTSYSVSL
jgi:hypothetical protein